MRKERSVGLYLCAAALVGAVASSARAAVSLPPLGDLPGRGFFSTATGVSGDGSVIVGNAVGGGFGGAFVWNADDGMQRLRDVLLAGGVNPATDGWSQLIAYDISADGNTIVGYGIRNGNNEAFVAVIPEPATTFLFGLSAGNQPSRGRCQGNSKGQGRITGRARVPLTRFARLSGYQSGQS